MISLRNTVLGAAALGCAAFASAPASAATFFGPSSYANSGDSPFANVNFSYFHLDDLQDGLLNTPGVTLNSSGFVLQGSASQSVDSLEYTPLGASLFSFSGAAGLDLSFDAQVLGALPTHAGIVWTDGEGQISFEAFDRNGVSLGIITGNHADNFFTGTTADDRFYGVTHADGISRFVLRNSNGGIEADHIQYGLQAMSTGGVPEPSAWALLILGFGAVGAGMRTRRRAAIAIA